MFDRPARNIGDQDAGNRRSRSHFSAIGADRIVVGTDFPADMGLDEPGKWLDGRAYLTGEERDLIKHENAAALGPGAQPATAARAAH